MIASIKIYIYGAIAFVIGLFVMLFKLRGSKIDSLEEEVHEAKIDGNIREYEAKNTAKAEDVNNENQNENDTTIADGKYTI